MGMDPNADDEEVTEEEIQMMVDTGSRKGTINPEESEMIHNVFEFNDLSVNDIATHRRDVTVLWTDDSEEEWNEIIRQTHHTMYPVCSEDIDNIVGVLNVRDYFCLTDHSRENVLKNAVKPAFFIPESVRADVLFRRMKQTRCHFAIVLDEYGGMEGIVTITDLLSEIVGDYDEEEEPEIVKLSDDSWQIRGTTSLEDVEDAIGISFDEEDCDTFGGLILSRKGFIPKDGSQFEMELSGLLIHVTEIQGHRIENTVVQRLPEEAETTARKFNKRGYQAMGKIGFDNEKYLAEQTRYILERVNNCNKLYLEFGGKLMNDLHAKRVLPGYDENVKMKLLQKAEGSGGTDHLRVCRRYRAQ